MSRPWAPFRLLSMIAVSLLIVCALASAPSVQAAAKAPTAMAASMDMADCPDMPSQPADCSSECAILCLAIRPSPPQVHYLPQPAPVRYPAERPSSLTDLSTAPDPPVPRRVQASEQTHI